MRYLGILDIYADDAGAVNGYVTRALSYGTLILFAIFIASAAVPIDGSCQVESLIDAINFRALVDGQIDAEVFSVFIGTGLELAFQEKSYSTQVLWPWSSG